MTDAIKIDTSSFTKFAKDLKDADKKLRRELSRNMKLAGELVAADARQRAGFSSRIPQNIKVGVRANIIRIFVNQSGAPEAKPLEHHGKEGTFRHPVFGNKDVWVSQPAHPFLAPALAAKKEESVLAAKKAVDDALAEVHSHG